MVYHLDFEKPIIELETKTLELETIENNDLNIKEELSRLKEKTEIILAKTYSKLTASQKVQVARHPDRPHFSHYINQMIDDFTPLAGDRCYGDDLALIGGLGRFKGQSCVIMGHEKGHDVETRLKHNFGMAKPEGYRKAQRLMKMGHQFKLPIITLIDTAGAYPGLEAEERGQSEAIAKSIETCFRVETPIVSVIIGEGGSGGAIAVAVADRILMLEHSIYSVISPEGCASILWRSAEFAKDAAAALKLTAKDLKKLGIIDKIIKEPIGGAHRAPKQMIELVANNIEKTLKSLNSTSGETLRTRRRQKFLEMGHNI